MGPVIGDKVPVSTPQDDKRKKGLAWQGVGLVRGWGVQYAKLEPVSWLWLRQTPVAIKDSSKSGVVRLALLSSVSRPKTEDLEGQPAGLTSIPLLILILFTESLDVCFAVRIEELLAALLPRVFEFGRCDVPVRPAFPGDSTQVLAEIFQSGPAEVPVAVVDLVDDETGLENNRVWNHGVVGWIGVLGDVEIFLDDPSRVGEERPVGADSTTIFIRLSNIVGANRDQPAISDLELPIEFHKAFRLPAVFGAEATAAQDEDHGMLSLQFGELPAFRGVVGKLIVGEDSPGNNGRSHKKPPTVGCESLRYVATLSS